MNNKKLYLWGSRGMIGSGIASEAHKYNFKVIDFGNQFNFRFGDIPNEQNFKILENAVLCIACGPRDEDVESLGDGVTYLNNISAIITKIPKSCTLVYISTARVYEGNTEQDINETTIPIPTTLYAKLHLDVEAIISSFSGKKIIFRPQAVYNYSKNESKRSYLITNDFPQLLLLGKKIILKSDGSPIRNFISSNDIGRHLIFYTNENVRIENNIKIVNVLGVSTSSILTYKNRVEAIFNQVKKGEGNIAESCFAESCDLNRINSIYDSKSKNNIYIDLLKFFRRNNA